MLAGSVLDRIGPRCNRLPDLDIAQASCVSSVAQIVLSVCGGSAEPTMIVHRLETLGCGPSQQESRGSATSSDTIRSFCDHTVMLISSKHALQGLSSGHGCFTIVLMFYCLWHVQTRHGALDSTFRIRGRLTACSERPLVHKGQVQCSKTAVSLERMTKTVT